jgi:hypothetical protein
MSNLFGMPLFQTSQIALKLPTGCVPSGQRGSSEERHVQSNGVSFWWRPTVAGLSLRPTEAWGGAFKRLVGVIVRICQQFLYRRFSNEYGISFIRAR